MKFFSGFSLKGEEELFERWLVKGDTVVAGFSYGAIKAFEDVYRGDGRVDRLLLFSPAFFQFKPRRYIELQLDSFRKNRDAYIDKFLERSAYPCDYSVMESYRDSRSDIDDLEFLLNYEWKIAEIEEVLERGTRIEVFTGSKDKIVDSGSIVDFFSGTVPCYEIKGAGHILKLAKEQGDWIL